MQPEALIKCDKGLKACSEGLDILAISASMTLGNHAGELAWDKFVNFGESIKATAEVDEELKAIVQAQDDNAKDSFWANCRQLANAQETVDDLEPHRGLETRVGSPSGDRIHSAKR